MHKICSQCVKALKQHSYQSHRKDLISANEAYSFALFIYVAKLRLFNACFLNAFFVFDSQIGDMAPKGAPEFHIQFNSFYFI